MRVLLMERIESEKNENQKVNNINYNYSYIMVNESFFFMTLETHFEIEEDIVFCFIALGVDAFPRDS